MEFTLSCDICGQSLHVEEINAAQSELVMDNWGKMHKHSTDELQIYHDAAVAVEKYRHSNPFGEESE